MSHRVVFGPYELDPVRGVLLRDGTRVELAPVALRLLALLVERPGRVWERGELLERLWSHRVVEDGALTQAVYLLRQALGEKPGERRYLATEPGRGYRFVQPLAPAGESRPLARSERDPAGALAVSPFAVLGDAGAYLGAALADALAHALGERTRLGVQRAVGHPAPAHRAVAQVEGSVLRSGDDALVLARLVRATDGTTLHTARCVVRCDDPLSFVVEAARRLAADLARQAGLPQRPAERAPWASELNPEARRALLRNRLLLERRTVPAVHRAGRELAEMVRLDPTSPEVWSALAEAHFVAGFYRLNGSSSRRLYLQAAEAAHRAIALDPEQAEAAACLAILEAVGGLDGRAAARRRLDTALPVATTAKHHRWQGLARLARGEWHEARESVARAHETDPVDPLTLSVQALLDYYQGEHGGALQRLDDSLELHPDFARGHLNRGLVLENMGRQQESERALRRAATLLGDSDEALAHLAHLYAAGGERTRAAGLRDRLERRGAAPGLRALGHLGAGETGRALELLTEAAEGGSLWYWELRFDPRYAALRAEPGFDRLLARPAG